MSLNKILIHLKALLWESIILVLPPPAAKRTLLQHYCTTIAQYTPPSPSPPSLAIPYAILVMAISCKGQHTTGRTPPFRYCLGRGAVTLGPFASRSTRYAGDPPSGIAHPTQPVVPPPPVLLRTWRCYPWPLRFATDALRGGPHLRAAAAPHGCCVGGA